MSNEYIPFVTDETQTWNFRREFDFSNQLLLVGPNLDKSINASRCKQTFILFWIRDS